MERPLIYADFHNADPGGRLRLNCIGTTQDLARLGVRWKGVWRSPSTMMKSSS